MELFNDTFLAGVLAARRAGIPSSESFRIGLISSAAGQGQLAQTFVLSTMMARRASRKAPGSGKAPERPVKPAVAVKKSASKTSE